MYKAGILEAVQEREKENSGLNKVNLNTINTYNKLINIYYNQDFWRCGNEVC